jgi:alkylation response protein AidB-like acyl-CoA dehydrogenase
VRLARMVDELVELARRTPVGGSLPGDERPAPAPGGRAIDDDEIARRLAVARAEVEALRSMTYRSVSRVARTGMPSAEASLIRLFFSELQQRVHALAMEILGPSILEWDATEQPAGTGAARARIRETWVFRWLLSFASTIAAGSKDIQRNIIGDRVLGLPR